VLPIPNPPLRNGVSTQEFLPFWLGRNLSGVLVDLVQEADRRNVCRPPGRPRVPDRYLK
jgi:hypothetical protein